MLPISHKPRTGIGLARRRPKFLDSNEDALFDIWSKIPPSTNPAGKSGGYSWSYVKVYTTFNTKISQN